MDMKNKFAKILLVSIDILAFYTSLIFAYFTRKFLSYFFADIFNLNFGLMHFIKLWWIPIIFLVFVGYEKLYTRRFPFWDEVKQLVKALSFAILVIFAIVSLGKMTNEISRLTLILLWLYGIVIFPIFRLYGKKFLFKIGLWQEPLIIVGSGDTGRKIAKALMEDTHTGYKVKGFIDDFKKGSVSINGQNLPILGKIKDFDYLRLDINTVVFAIPSMDKEKLTNLVNHFHTKVGRVFIVPDLQGISLLNSELYHLFMQQLFMIRINNNLKSNLNQILKRSFDLILSIAMLPVLLPLIGILGILIKIDSRGPIFFAHTRIGKNGKLIKVYKFRSMYVDAQKRLEEILKNNPEAKKEWETYFKLKDDPRVTRVGKFLRKTSLDELPQIFNVLKGDMSLVGPRPVIKDEIDKYYKEYASYYYMVRPGITGLWQVSGRSDTDYDFRVKLDTWYVLNWSLWLDIVILFKTVKVVLKREGAY